MQVEKALGYVYNSGLNAYALYKDCFNGDVLEGNLKRYVFDMKNIFPNKTISQLAKKLSKKHKVS